MLNELTKKQEKQLMEHREEYLRWGLCCDPANKQLAVESISKMYSLIDKKTPYFWFCSSPLMIHLVIQVLKNIKLEKGANLGANLRDNLRDNLWANLRDNLWANLGDNLRANLWANLRANLRDNLEANLRDNLWDNLRANLRDNLWDNLRANLRDNLEANLRDNLRDNLWANLRDNLWANLWANLRDNLWANLEANLRANLEANLRANLWDNLRANLGDSDFWGQMDMYWICYYLFPAKYLDINYGKYQKILNLWESIGKSIGWWYPYENICFISDRPQEIHKKGIQLHNDKGPALLFRDGYAVYVLNSVNVPQWLVETPAEGINPELALKEKNADVQREIIRKIGAERLIQKLNPTVLDKWTHDTTGLKYQLLEVVLPNSEARRRYMYYEHASIPGVFYAKPVPPETKNCIQGRGFQVGIIEREDLSSVSDDYILARLPLTVQ